MTLPESFGFRDCSNRGGHQNELGPRHVGWRCWAFPTEERFNHHPDVRALQLVTGQKATPMLVPHKDAVLSPCQWAVLVKIPPEDFAKRPIVHVPLATSKSTQDTLL